MDIFSFTIFKSLREVVANLIQYSAPCFHKTASKLFIRKMPFQDMGRISVRKGNIPIWVGKTRDNLTIRQVAHSQPM